jgi:hypothetical protein
MEYTLHIPWCLCLLKCYDKKGVAKRTLYDFVYLIVYDVRLTQL